MSIQLSRAEFWLLNLVVEWRYPLARIDATNPDFFNHPCIGVPLDEIVETVWAMNERGWIRIYRLDDESEVALCGPADLIPLITLPSNAPGHPENEPFWRKQGLSGKPVVAYFGLTEIGGAIWEEFTQPNWEFRVVKELNFESYSHPGSSPDDHILLRGSDEARLRWASSLVRRSIDVEYQCELKREPLKRSIEPYHAVYWKQLPRGWEIRFNLKRRPQVDRGRKKLHTHGPAHEAMMHWNWFADLWRQWAN
ncbi:hypothetical protein [Stratiformator vulcanicus]|uniref:Uncharacterized protein n=1 Tax=Stratiformator vulcanicus TaxID=2527980 RepID=A0A517QWP9_9PLAN|nr:hypothetical protein [Stratiformator vulcanicus]QDT36092.1 hypothetical protein Pan189_04470 [Stratiformator vulcanicus]